MAFFDTVFPRIDHGAITAYLSYQRIKEAEAEMTALLGDINSTLKELAVASKAAPESELCSASLEWLCKDVSPSAIILVLYDRKSSEGGGRAAILTPFGTVSCLFTYESHAERKSIANRLFAAIERRTGQSVKQSPVTLKPVFMFRNGSCEPERWREPYEQNVAFVLWQPPKPQFDPELVITHLPTPLRTSVGALRLSCGVVGSIDDDEIYPTDLLPSIEPPPLPPHLSALESMCGVPGSTDDGKFITAELLPLLGGPPINKQ